MKKPRRPEACFWKRGTQFGLCRFKPWLMILDCGLGTGAIPEPQKYDLHSFYVRGSRFIVTPRALARQYIYYVNSDATVIYTVHNWITRSAIHTFPLSFISPLSSSFFSPLSHKLPSPYKFSLSSSPKVWGEEAIKNWFGEINNW